MGILQWLFGEKSKKPPKPQTSSSNSPNSSIGCNQDNKTTSSPTPNKSYTSSQDIQTNILPKNQNNAIEKKFRALDKVLHYQYGEGTVLESIITDGNEIITVQFKNSGLKHVSAESLKFSEHISSNDTDTADRNSGKNTITKQENNSYEETDHEKLSTIEELFKEDLENVEFTGEFASAFNLMENTTDNFIITGKAGTGKSTLLKYFLVHTNKNAVALAPTGVSAINIKGDTIHSFFRFKPKILDDSDIKIVYDDKYKNIDTIIIDEFSMVNANLFDAINLQMRANGKDGTKPFGGAQIIMFGDFFQLPPVVTKDEVAMFFAKEYGSPWFFSSKSYKDSDLKFRVIELQQNHRQGNTEFAQILDHMRLGQQTDDELKMINSRFGAKIGEEEYPIILVPSNRKADEINSYYLNSLPGDSVILEGKVEGDFPPKRYPTQLKLQLKPGAQIMMLVNDSQHRFVNGTIGRVMSITDDDIEIEIKQRGNFYKYKVGKYPWRNYAYRYSSEDHKVVREQIGTFYQFPIKLAWAITVHKSQGLTFNAVTLDIGNKSFANGQAYVAVSRCRSLEGLRLNSKIYSTDIKVDPYALEFYKNNVSRI